ncbi:hypothetical protein [Psychrobacter sp. I-STPA10]|uniref:hypothetical protein n=1 Tax=Psychrobacter sp. I-STPA10 TaxID=2585769 RepID=UPI001E3A6271|nr:hypothetical protein [Psychrobacter sp. I-STPA10]
MYKYILRIFGVSLFLLMSGCDTQFLGYDIVIQKEGSSNSVTVVDKDSRLSSVYEVVSIGDSEQLVVLAMGEPDTNYQEQGTLVSSQIYEWYTDTQKYEIDFIYGRVHKKSKTLINSSAP